MYSWKSFFVAWVPPAKVATFVADESQNFKKRCSIVFNERPWEVGDWNREQVGVEVSIDIVDGVR